jgi:acetylornithine/succinyldiaminopimelate/putrescine aminotransferase
VSHASHTGEDSPRVAKALQQQPLQLQHVGSLYYPDGTRQLHFECSAQCCHLQRWRVYLCAAYDDAG